MNITPIGIAHTDFQQRLGIPRQPGLTPSAKGKIVISQDISMNAFEGIESFSHVWLIFGFHELKSQPKMKVRPPRLGGNERIGVFATRSPYRPNGMGMSVVQLDAIDQASRCLFFSNHDLLDQTPIFDIKPYIKQWDSIPSANDGWLEDSQSDNEKKLRIQFLPQTHAILSENEGLEQLIQDTISLDPRSSWMRREMKATHQEKIWKTVLRGFEVSFQINKNNATILKIEPICN